MVIRASPIIWRFSSIFKKARSTSSITWMCRAPPSWIKRSCYLSSAPWKGSPSASTTWPSIGILSCSSTPRGGFRTPRLNGVPSPRPRSTRRTSPRGFPNATFEWSSKPASEVHQTDLTYVIHEGQQEFVRDILISGLQNTRRSLVDRNMLLKAGDPLSPTAMRESQRRLYDLGVFARVDTAIQNPDGDSGEKYVLYDMEEAHKYSTATGFGAEFARIGGCSTCLEAPQGQTGFAPDFTLDVSRLDLWGLGQSLSFRGRVSTLEQRALINYTVPRLRGNEKLTLSYTILYDN